MEKNDIIATSVIATIISFIILTLFMNVAWTCYDNAETIKNLKKGDIEIIKAFNRLSEELGAKGSITIDGNIVK